MGFDLLVRGSLLIDGSGQPGRPADIGIEGDRAAAVGDLSAVSESEISTVIDATGLVVAPGFIDPHGHSDASVLIDGALASHLRQGYTTQSSAGCGYAIAPLTPAARALLQPDLVVLDPATVLDRATFEEPASYPLGIPHVVVNGVLVVRDGEETGEQPGRLLRAAS